MPNTKALRVRIKSVKSTEQLTKAMGLVASSKIRRANIAMYKAREYIASLEKSMSYLPHPLMCKKALICKITTQGTQK
jgi:F-type H+-transporting ATPase subunit gamma